MRKLNIDKNIITISILALILLCAILIFIPLQLRILTNVNKKINALRTNLLTARKEWPVKDRYFLQSEKLKSELKDLRQKFIIPQEESALFSYISSESKNFDINIRVLKPQPLQDYLSTKLGKFKFVPITINAQGKFHNLARFFDYIQRGKFFFDVTELKISSGSLSHSIEITICGLMKEK
jgi:hypothetical protein